MASAFGRKEWLICRFRSDHLAAPWLRVETGSTEPWSSRYLSSVAIVGASVCHALGREAAGILGSSIGLMLDAFVGIKGSEGGCSGGFERRFSERYGMANVLPLRWERKTRISGRLEEKEERWKMEERRVTAEGCRDCRDGLLEGRSELAVLPLLGKERWSSTHGIASR